MDEGVVRALAAEADHTDERRAIVVHGARERCYAASRQILSAADIAGTATTCLTEGDIGPAEHLSPARSGELLGRTRDAVVVDWHDQCRPNALGRAVGAVDGGGLLLVLAPPLAKWANGRDGVDERLAVPPFDLAAVGTRFRRRLVNTLRAHRGIAIFDADAETWTDEGVTNPAPRLPVDTASPPAEGAFPQATYAMCRTADQLAAVRTLESLREPGTATIVEADRGRGKSAAAGLAAGALAAAGQDVLVTAPDYRNAAEVFDRAAALLSDLDAFAERGDGGEPVVALSGGRVRFVRPVGATDASADAVIVDEAAALPVRVLQRVTAGDRPVAFATTVHGYEGSGRGFDVRFRGWLADTDRSVQECSMTEPVRYAAGDPIEVWAFRALLFDAAPPVQPLVADATPDSVDYVAVHPETLVANEHLLREAFGLLVAAHYRTEPDDLARLLDAPNLTLRTLTHEGHVVAVALLAWEGALPPDLRQSIYEGGRVRGNLLPDVLTAQLRDPAAGEPRGLRVVRIAVHDAIRSRGLGSQLLAAIAEEFGNGDTAVAWHEGRGPDALVARHERAGGPFDYLGVGFGATPELLRFWTRAGYRSLHLATTRSDASGEYSALMATPITDAGAALVARTEGWLRRQLPAVLADSLDDCDPAVVVGVLRATDGNFDLDLTEREWRAVAAAAYGNGYFDAAPRPFRRLVVKGIAEGIVDGEDAHLLVRRVLQTQPWSTVADEFEYVSKRQCVKAFVTAVRPLVDEYGGPVAEREAARYR